MNAIKNTEEAWKYHNAALSTTTLEIKLNMVK
jgi:hypothetical protein